MAITRASKKIRKEDKANLRDAISSLKKSMTDYKAERKTEWKSFKSKFKDDMNNIERSLDKLKTLRKK